jgi:hypothetical protein
MLTRPGNFARNWVKLSSVLLLSSRVVAGVLLVRVGVVLVGCRSASARAARTPE